MKKPNVRRMGAADMAQALPISEKLSVVIASLFSQLRIWQFAAVVRRPCEIRPLQTPEPPCETDSITASAHTSPNAKTGSPLYKALLRTCSCRPFSGSAWQRNGLEKVSERRLVYSANDMARMSRIWIWWTVTRLRS
jgi:hypothetical protein